MLVALGAGILLASASGGVEAALLYPDLETFPPRSLRFDYTDVSVDGSGVLHHVLRFSNTALNVGEGPVEIRATIDDSRNPPSGPAYQRVYDSNGGFSDLPLSGSSLYYHAIHKHYHFDDWGGYQLWTKAAYDRWASTGSGGPDLVGTKTTSCVTDEEFAAPIAAAVFPGRYPPSKCMPDAQHVIGQGLSPGLGRHVRLLPLRAVDRPRREIIAARRHLRAALDRRPRQHRLRVARQGDRGTRGRRGQRRRHDVRCLRRPPRRLQRAERHRDDRARRRDDDLSHRAARRAGPRRRQRRRPVPGLQRRQRLGDVREQLLRLELPDAPVEPRERVVRRQLVARREDRLRALPRQGRPLGFGGDGHHRLRPRRPAAGDLELRAGDRGRRARQLVAPRRDVRAHGRRPGGREPRRLRRRDDARPPVPARDRRRQRRRRVRRGLRRRARRRLPATLRQAHARGVDQAVVAASGRPVRVDPDEGRVLRAAARRAAARAGGHPGRGAAPTQGSGRRDRPRRRLPRRRHLRRRRAAALRRRAAGRLAGADGWRQLDRESAVRRRLERDPGALPRNDRRAGRLREGARCRAGRRTPRRRRRETDRARRAHGDAPLHLRGRPGLDEHRPQARPA